MQNNLDTAQQNALSFENQNSKKSRPILVWLLETILLLYFVLMALVFGMFVVHLINQYKLVGENFLPAVWVDMARIFGFAILSFFALYKTHQAQKIGKVLVILLSLAVAIFSFYQWLNSPRSVTLNQTDIAVYQIGQLAMSLIFITLASVVGFSKSIKAYFE